MRILIVEDERPIARYVEDLTRECLGERVTSIRVCHGLEDASGHLSKQAIDLCLLDLNLNGEDGFDLLKQAAAGSFYTIVVSANTERALEAFQYGVIDFVPKPFQRARLQEALDRCTGSSGRAAFPVRVLAAKRGRDLRLVPVDRVRFFRAADNYVEAHLYDGSVELLDKTMGHLERILPPRFRRVHRSYVVDGDQIRSFGHVGGGCYEVRLEGDVVVPLSRVCARELRQLYRDDA